MLNQKKILITGGTGSFGKKFAELTLKTYPKIGSLVIYSRDPLKQQEMAQTYPKDKYPNIKYVIGDVRDADRLKRACEGIDIIIHAAALKYVPIAENNPTECIHTNVMGAENVIKAALDTDVSRVIALSTDKAAAPVNLYGATKLCADKLFIAANNIRGDRDLRFSVVRYGNVFGSRGSVIPLFLEQRGSGVLPITHEEMTRFNITLEEAVKLVFFAVQNAWGGELFVPKIPSYKILTLKEAIGPDCQTKLVGVRPGEKIHEEMITEHDSLNTYDCGRFFVIAPQTPIWNKTEWAKQFHATPVQPGFRYHSGMNPNWLSAKEIRNLIKTHVDPEFTV